MSVTMRRVAKLVLSGVFFLLFHTSGSQTFISTDPQELRRVLDKTVAEVAGAEAVVVDPRLLEQMSQSLGIYAFNFCSSPTQDCGTTLSGGPTMRKAVADHLRVLRELPNSPIQVFGDRLANGEFPMAGWPTHQTVEVGLLKLPPALHGVPLHMRFATGLMRLGAGKVLLALPGPLTLEANVGGKYARWTAVVPNRQTATLNLEGDLSNAARPLQPLPTAFCRQSDAVPVRGPFEVFNHGRATFTEDPRVRAANQAPFLTQHGVDISVATEPGIACDSDCEYSLSSLFADAVATWRVGCARCEANALVVLRSNTTVWIDWRIARRLRLAAEGAAVKLDLSEIDIDEQTTNGVQTFADLSADTTALTRLCRIRPEDAPWVATAQQLACQRTNVPTASAHTIRPVVTLTQGDTSCGKLAIACGLPRAGIEISLSVYRYALPGFVGNGDIVIGPNSSGPILEMRHVIMHEVGHWFGVPHAQVAGTDQFLDVMAETYGEGSECLAAQSLRMFSNAGDLRWPHRIEQGGALMAPRGSTPQRRDAAGASLQIRRDGSSSLSTR
jgi:hypothetical protein